MKDINYYRRISGTYGTKNKRDVNIKKTQTTLFKNMLEHPNCQEVKFNNETEKDYAVIITDKNNNKFLIRQPDKKIKCGDLIKWNTDTWLCLSIDEDETIYSKGVIQKTTHKLKWIDSSDNLITKPSITSAQTLYTTGVKDEKLMEIPNGMVGIQLPYDEDTKKLKRDDSFIFNDTKYRITFLNKVEFPGLIALICEEEVVDKLVDDLENEIANRYINGKDRLSDDTTVEPDEPIIPEDPIEPQEPIEDNFTIEIIGADKIPVLSEQIYTAKVYNNGVEVDKPVTWAKTTNLTNIKSQDGNTITLSANKDWNMGKFTLTATLVDDETIFTERILRVTY